MQGIEFCQQDEFGSQSSPEPPDKGPDQLTPDFSIVRQGKKLTEPTQTSDLYNRDFKVSVVGSH